MQASVGHPSPGKPAATPTDRIARQCLVFLQEVLGGFHPRDFTFRFWDGTVWGPEPGESSRFTMVLRNPGVLRTMFWSPSELALGEAYLYNDLDIEGDIGSAFLLADRLVHLRLSLDKRLRFARLLLALPSTGRHRGARPTKRLRGPLHSIGRDRQAVTYHYDMSNAFYSLWLDERMVYSCAFFTDPGDNLDTAQERKLEYICRKLRLQRGDHVLDIGCGWGGLVIYAARNYGVQAYGITLSRPQADLANERIRLAGLSDRCRVDVRDYREIHAPESYDKLVSVGMFEHVGESRLLEYFRGAFRLLRPGGVFLNHGIACIPGFPPVPGPSFSDHYIFPDGELLPLGTTLRAAEASGFEVRDVESLREHYTLTLRHWVQRLEARREEACSVTDEKTYRLWRLYLAGAGHKFRMGQNSVYQVLLSKTFDGMSGLPLTRGDWYSGGVDFDPRKRRQS
ncbi:MAG: Cyclopropane-fatty-acyl-phospholipid synthase [Deltaproteobacteria bacterium]|nr:Cyclopropane-fatty-acyl-phospholipid synthase [Deltaproteobacteria bacterium]